MNDVMNLTNRQIVNINNYKVLGFVVDASNVNNPTLPDFNLEEIIGKRIIIKAIRTEFYTNFSAGTGVEQRIYKSYDTAITADFSQFVPGAAFPGIRLDPVNLSFIDNNFSIIINGSTVILPTRSTANYGNMVDLNLDNLFLMVPSKIEANSFRIRARVQMVENEVGLFNPFIRVIFEVYLTD